MRGMAEALPKLEVMAGEDGDNVLGVRIADVAKEASSEIKIGLDRASSSSEVDRASGRHGS